MKFSEWLTETKTTPAAFARKIGENKVRISRVANGSVKVPRPDLIEKITQHTEGKVTANDFYSAQEHPTLEGASA